MKNPVLILLLLLAFVIWNCNQDPKSRTQANFTKYCGNCHLTPDPASLPKEIWEKRVLPNMAARLGFTYNNYNPFAGNSMEENLYIRLSNTYPEEAIIDSITWWDIHDYILNNAPDQLKMDSSRSNRNTLLTSFETQKIYLDSNQFPAITFLENEENQLIIGDAFGKVYQGMNHQKNVTQFKSPIVGYQDFDGDIYITEIGYMHPSQKPTGAIHRVSGGQMQTIAQKLHRPVFSQVVDLNDDQSPEVLICEFGNLTGELSILMASDTGFVKKTLLPIPGILKFEIQDLNGDGKKDIIALASQAQEGIYIFYQKEKLRFQLDHAIQLDALSGSSWFTLTDYNQDGYSDIAMVNGDNADYSIIPKTFHGFRLFLNNGNNTFEESFFYPIYGATRVETADFDQDGDIDFVVSAFFPEYDLAPDESIIFFENQGLQEFQFNTYTTPMSTYGRWMTLAKIDYEKDGDLDIILGSFILTPDQSYNKIMPQWQEDKVDFLLLENKIND